MLSHGKDTDSVGLQESSDFGKFILRIKATSPFFQGIVYARHKDTIQLINDGHPKVVQYAYYKDEHKKWKLNRQVNYFLYSPTSHEFDL